MQKARWKWVEMGDFPAQLWGQFFCHILSAIHKEVGSIYDGMKQTRLGNGLFWIDEMQL